MRCVQRMSEARPSISHFRAMKSADPRSENWPINGFSCSEVVKYSVGLVGGGDRQWSLFMENGFPMDSKKSKRKKKAATLTNLCCQCCWPLYKDEENGRSRQKERKKMRVLNIFGDWQEIAKCSWNLTTWLLQFLEARRLNILIWMVLHRTNLSEFRSIHFLSTKVTRFDVSDSDRWAPGGKLHPKQAGRKSARQETKNNNCLLNCHFKMQPTGLLAFCFCWPRIIVCFIPCTENKAGKLNYN